MNEGVNLLSNEIAALATFRLYAGSLIVCLLFVLRLNCIALGFVRLRAFTL